MKLFAEIIGLIFTGILFCALLFIFIGRIILIFDKEKEEKFNSQNSF